MAQDIPVEVENPLSIFNIIQKEDSAEKLAYVTGNKVPNKNVIFAPEFNKIKDQLIQNTLDNIAIDYFWDGSVPMNRDSANLALTAKFLDAKVRLLGVKISNPEILNYGQMSIIIERYKPAKKGKTSYINEKGSLIEVDIIKKSGYRKFDYDANLYPDRKSELPIVAQSSILDFGQEWFFSTSSTPTNYIMASGMSDKNTSIYQHQAQCYLQLRLVFVHNGKTYTSNNPKKITMVCNPAGISYKLI